MKAAEENRLDLHIWKRKEIENYILEPKVIFRLISRPQNEYNDFLVKLERLVDSFKDDVFDQYAEHIVKYRKCATSTANKEARDFINENWNSLENKLALVSGKNMLKAIIKWMKEEYGVSCTRNKLIDTFKAEDISKEVSEIISKLVMGLEINY